MFTKPRQKQAFCCCYRRRAKVEDGPAQRSSEEDSYDESPLLQNKGVGRPKRTTWACGRPRLFDLVSDVTKNRLLFVLVVFYLFGWFAQVILLVSGIKEPTLDDLLNNGITTKPQDPIVTNTPFTSTNPYYAPESPYWDTPDQIPQAPVLTRVEEATLFQITLEVILAAAAVCIGLPLLTGVSGYQHWIVSACSTLIAAICISVQCYLQTTKLAKAINLMVGDHTGYVVPRFLMPVVHEFVSEVAGFTVFLFYLKQTYKNFRFGSRYDFDTKRLEDYSNLVRRLLMSEDAVSLLVYQEQLKANSGCCGGGNGRKSVPVDQLWANTIKRSASRSRSIRLGYEMAVSSSDDDETDKQQPTYDTDDESGMKPPAIVESDYVSPTSARIRQSVRFEDEIDREQEKERQSRDELPEVKTGAVVAEACLRSLTYSARATKAAIIGFWKGMKACCRRKVKQHEIFERPSDFRFPLRLLVTAVVSIFAVFLVSMLMLSYYVQLSDYIRDLNAAVEASGTTLVLPEGLAAFLSHAEEKVLWAGIGSILFSLMVVGLNWRATFIHYREMVFSLRQGIYPIKKDDYYSYDSVSLIGYFITHNVAGFFLVVLVMNVFLLLVNLLATIQGARDVFVNILKVSGSMVLIRTIFAYMARLIFMTWRGKIVRFPTAFQFIDFIDLFLNALTGLFVCLIRLIVSACFIAINFSRLDIPIFPGGFEGYDAAYSTFAATLMLDHHHNNPIKIVFIDLLWRLVRNHPSTKSNPHHPLLMATYRRAGTAPPTEEKEDTEHSRRIRRKWYLIITLIKNPSLVKDRKHNLKKNSDLASTLKEQLRTTPSGRRASDAPPPATHAATISVVLAPNNGIVLGE